MGRPRQPTAVQDLKGYFRQHPERRRDNEPQATEPLGAPREGSPADMVQAWEEIAAQAPEGVLMQSDRFIVEIASNLLAEMRRDFASFQSGKLAALHKALAQMGMSPASRAGLSIPATKAENPFDQF